MIKFEGSYTPNQPSPEESPRQHESRENNLNMFDLLDRYDVIEGRINSIDASIALCRDDMSKKANLEAERVRLVAEFEEVRTSLGELNAVDFAKNFPQ